MAYIANTYIEDKKKLKKELKKIHGIGFGKMKLLNAIFNTKKESYSNLNNLSKLKMKSLILNNIKTGPLLDKHNKYSLDLLKSIKCYKGQRHILNLPVRGQRTCTNNKTRKKLK